MNTGTQNREPVIDLHCHLIALGSDSGGWFSPRLRRSIMTKWLFFKLGWKGGDDNKFDRFYANLLAGLVRESETTDYGVALALDGLYDANSKLDTSRTDYYVPNDYVAQVCARHRELLFGASVNPDRADALEELEKVKEAGAVLVKWLPNSQGIDPANKKYIPFYRKLAELSLPLLSHAGYEHTIPSIDQNFGDPARMVTALEEGATVIACHAGASGHLHPVEFFDGYIKLLDRYPNLYGDLAALTTPSRFGYVSKLLAKDGAVLRHAQATDFPVPPWPFLFMGNLGIAKTVELSRIKNHFDRDIKTKLALGIPESCLYLGAKLIGVCD